MAVWTASAVITTVFMTLYKSEDFAVRLNMKIGPSFEFQLTMVGVMVFNCIFCYIWEVIFASGRVSHFSGNVFLTVLHFRKNTSNIKN